ncbi:MAG: metallophosphoesterase [Clostridia bacterium]|nr:metallophosphoesterase [Clostridia bacterium]
MIKPNLQFQNGKFTVLHVTDAQDLHYVRSSMFRMLDAAYDQLKPDLVLIAGDNILGNHICDSRIPHGPLVKDPVKEWKSICKAIRYLVEPIAERGIPFAVVFGNHDDSPHFSKEDMAEVYRAYPLCYGLGGEEATGDADNDCVSIFSSDGARVAYNLWLINSVRHTADGKSEDYVTERAVAWYKAESARFTAQNSGKPVPALWFQHMPLAETARVLETCDATDRGAVKGPDGLWYRIKHGKGIMHRYPRMVERSNGEFEVIKACGDVKAVVTGHDHVNHFRTTLDGIDLILTPCVSMRCNSNRTRGVRTFVLDEAGGYETHFYSYQDLLGTSIKTELPFLIQADGLKRERITLACGAAAAFCVLVGGAITAIRALTGRR